LRGEAGLDRALLAVLGDAAHELTLARALPAVAGVWFAFDTDVARLGRAPEIAVRVDGQLIGGGCDLLHGDVVEIRPAGHPPDQPFVRVEVC
ncbi:MAG TPA: hypothetical protein VMU50_11220, partial [Polyangia bacterium]|nr:hypothetical protein [Polyangia bacterium]